MDGFCVCDTAIGPCGIAWRGGSIAGVQLPEGVYEVTRAIAPGRTLSYGEVAAAIGEPGAAHAVGQALGHNPFAPIVPCHRVLAARSGAGGFSAEGGVVMRLRLHIGIGADHR